MNVFVPFASPLKTAEILDKKRLHKQTIECDWIINCTKESRSFKHPAVKMWKPYLEWLELYKQTLLAVRKGDLKLAMEFSNYADSMRPAILFYNELMKRHKARLFTKDPDFYSRFSSLEPTDVNMYVQTDIEGSKYKFILQQTHNGKYLEDIDITKEVRTSLEDELTRTIIYESCTHVIVHPDTIPRVPSSHLKALLSTIAK